MSSNMRFYDKAREVPVEARKPIQAGRLKGMTDVNPMYRIKRLTEMFGPCGLGWWYEIVDERIVDDTTTNQRAAFTDILLFYRDPETGEESKGIPGTGGASFLSQERNGPYLSDECFKMALTDAISVAAKALGIAADVYWEKDRTKYTTSDDPAPAPRQGSTAGAQAAGRAKLDRINAQIAQAATGAPTAPTAAATGVTTAPTAQAERQPVDLTGSKQMATDEQKQMLRKMVNIEQLASCTKMYGPNWERMPANAASSLIAKIRAATGVSS